MSRRTTEASETVLEGTRVVPEPGAPILVVQTIGGTTSANEDDGNDHEDNCSRQLEQRSPKLFLGVSHSTKDVDDDDQDQENL